jgi:hypothetical protein
MTTQKSSLAATSSEPCSVSTTAPRLMMPRSRFSTRAGIRLASSMKRREAASRQSTRRRISVTDLVNVRQAYFRPTRPDIQIPLERRQLM